MTGSNDGMPTRSARLHTIFAVVFEFATCRNKNRSKAQPTTGPITTTDTKKASNPEKLWYSVRYVKMKADA